MLLLSRFAVPLLLLRAAPPPHVLMQAGGNGDAPSPSGDELLMRAMAMLKDREGSEAQALLWQAQAAYDALPDGPSDEQQQLLRLVSERVDAAVMPGFGRTEAKRPPPPTKEELQARAEAKARGERALMNTVQTFGNKADPERFGKAMALLEEARANFRRAGDAVERERDGVMGNLYSAIRAEEERAQRVKKLVRMKRQLELVKQKRKAEVMGIDPDEFEASQQAPADGAEGGDMADDILAAWKAEDLDDEAAELDELERQIDDLESQL